MRMRPVHLSMRTEVIKAFSKRMRRCSVDGRKRYESVDANLFENGAKRGKTALFSFENGLVWTVVQSLNSPFFPPHLGAEPGRAKEESRQGAYT